MPRKNPNITNYHYRADIYDDDNKLIVSKYYYTLNDMCTEYKTSTFTIYRIMKNPDYVPKTCNLKGVKFFRDYQPAIITSIRTNEKIYGVLDEI
tara:strand:+ start:2194 stop:2475 length:282 start_codon:yes stop_codon:yes gene_type:complete